MSNRISKKQAAEMLGVHEKTLERYIDNADFRTGTGYQKNPLNSRVSFDADLVADYAFEKFGTDPTTPTSSDKSEQALVVRQQSAPAVAAAAPAQIEMDRDRAAETMFRAFLVPHKLFLTVREAQSLTGFPQNVLRGLSEKAHSINCKVKKQKNPKCSCPRLIRRAKLEAL